MTNTAINNAENSTEDTNVDPAQTEATSKKRNTSSKGKITEDSTKVEAPEDIKTQADEVKATHTPEAFLNGFNSKRTLEVKNNGPRSFEIYTKTPLPASETVVLELENDRLYRMVLSKFTQLNKLAGKERYTVKEL